MVGGHVPGLKHPGRALAQLTSRNDAALDHAQRGHGVYLHDLRCRFKRKLTTVGPFTRTMDANAIVIAEGVDPRLGPAIAAPGRLAGAIEEPCDLFVGH